MVGTMCRLGVRLVHAERGEGVALQEHICVVHHVLTSSMTSDMQFGHSGGSLPTLGIGSRKAVEH